MLPRQVFRTAEKREIHPLKRLAVNGMDEGHLVPHLVQLAAYLVIVQEQYNRPSQRRLRKRFLQFASQQRGRSGNSNLVHNHPFLSFRALRVLQRIGINQASVLRLIRPAPPPRDHEYAARAQMPENI